MSRRCVVLALFALLLAVLQFVPGAGLGEARAACSPAPGYGSGLEGSSITCTYRDQAWAAITAENNYLNTHSPQRSYTISLNTSCGTGYYCYRFSGISNGYGAPAYQARFLSASQCPSGTTWNDVSKTCFGAAACLAKPALGFSKIVSATGVFSSCSEGCRFEPSGSSMAVGNDDGTYTSFTTGWKASGSPCQAGDAAPSLIATLQDCVPAGAGQSFCIKPNGDHCYTVTSTSKQICWKPRETGEKASGDKLQVRNAGATATTPTTPPPAGDSIAPIGTSVTKTETVNGTTVVTTTTNYATTYGSQAGASDQGEPADGSGSPAGGGSGDGNGDGTATGGDCPAAWSCAGDEVGCAILAEEHQQRCATEGLNAELQAGTGDFGGDGNPDDAFGLSSLGSDTLDSSGFLSRSDCPAPVEIPGLPGLNLNAAVCPGASIWAIYMLIGAYIQAAYIIGRAAAGGSA